jgi:hypothetical protein
MAMLGVGVYDAKTDMEHPRYVLYWMLWTAMPGDPTRLNLSRFKNLYMDKPSVAKE